MASSLGLDGRFWPCNEDLHWCWFSPHGVSRVYCVLILKCCLQCLFSRILLFNVARFNLTTGIRAMVWLGYARWCFYVHNQIVGCMFGGTRHPSSNFLVHVKLSHRQVWISLDAKSTRYPSYVQRRDVASSVE